MKETRSFVTINQFQHKKVIHPAGQVGSRLLFISHYKKVQNF